jgi:D-glycero-beta-D-manno-heptose 1-phosphate adenylyltransferase
VLKRRRSNSRTEQDLAGGCDGRTDHLPVAQTENTSSSCASPVLAFERKVCAPSELAQRLAELKRPLVFTNGVFDLLHRGHVTYLAQARALGASLVVALNTDACVKRLGKGAERPINGLEDRLAVIAALESVSLATWFESDTPLDLILLCRPEVLVKGGDWQREHIIGANEVLGWGGAVHSIAFLHERSTSTLLQRIRNP